MNRARSLVLAAVFAAFWCTGAFFLLPRMENKLRDSAARALSAQHTLAGRLDRLQVSFEGQTARLTGLVRTVQDRQIAEVTLRDFVRAPATLAPGFSSGLNPVDAVRNELEIAPFPAGWMLLASDGARAVSLTTWAFWTVSNLTSIAYGWVVLHDLSFTLIFAGNAVCTGVVTVIAARKRLAWRAAGSRRAVHAA